MQATNEQILRKTQNNRPEKYHKNYFNHYKDIFKKQWEMINSLLGSEIFRKDHIKLKDNDGNIISSKSEVAEKFNDYQKFSIRRDSAVFYKALMLAVCI